MRVLVCDDEPVIRKLVELSLRGSGHDLRTVGSGAEALATMRDWAPDVLLTDSGLSIIELDSVPDAARTPKESAVISRQFLEAAGVR